MTHFALIFPGQGSQSIGMLSELAVQHACVKKLFNQASDILHYDLWELTQNGPAEKLDQTEFTQPALLAADIAVYECWKLSHDEKPTFLAGHSLGEYAALVCAEAIHFNDAISLVSARGKFMQEAVLPGAGAMAAIVGLEDHVVEEICKQASQYISDELSRVNGSGSDSDRAVSPANYNSIGQIVIAGNTSAVEKAIQLADEKGAKIAKKIPVSVPSHCALMQSAADAMAEKLKSIEIKSPAISVIQNADVKIHHTSTDIRDALVRQLISPVRWVETIQYMMNNGVNTFYECGPGKVLAGLNKRISKDIINL
ncbi:MAG: ACP S-malonyltransferase [Gammaproteobacteria bacterium]|nr:ACP S-malonyltransferase [Gammaproteobacteria bacterium]